VSGEFKQRVSFILVACTGVAAILLLAWSARIILLLLFAGLIGALLLSILTDSVERLLKLRRSIAFSIVLASLALFLGLGIWMRGPAIAQQFSDLQVDLPSAMRQVLARMRAETWGQWLLSRYSDAGQLASGAEYLLARIGGAVLTTASTIAGLYVILAVSIYVAAEPGSYLRLFDYITPAEYRGRLTACLTGAAQLLRSWLLAKLIAMITIGAFIALGLWIMQVPLAGTLGLIAALLTFVPNLGPVLSVVPAALLAFAVSPAKGILTVLLFAAAHFLEGSIVMPLLERKIVSLPPALTLTAQLLLASIAGPVGIVLAAPLTAVGLGILQALHVERPHTDATFRTRLRAYSSAPPRSTLSASSKR